MDGHPGSSVAAGQDKTATVILKRSSTGRAAVQRGCVCPVAAVQRRERNGGRRGGRALRSKLISKDRVEKTGRGSISVTAGGFGGACILGLIS